jgi:hypothetical protein
VGRVPSPGACSEDRRRAVDCQFIAANTLSIEGRFFA